MVAKARDVTGRVFLLGANVEAIERAVALRVERPRLFDTDMSTFR
jgi:hypothetical protein